MTGARTVTVLTLDHGPIAVPEPDWCTGHAGEPVDYRDDLCHARPVPTRTALVAELVAYPFGRHPVEASIYIEIDIPGRTLDPAGLEALACDLDEQAAELRQLATRLTALRAGGAW